MSVVIDTARRTFRSLTRAYDLAGVGRSPAGQTVARVTSEIALRALSGLTRMELPVDDYWGFGTKAQFLLGWYEHETVRVCRQLLAPGTCVLDVGAHCGYFTRLFARAVGSSGHVFAFEPHPPTFSCLTRNTRGLSNVTCARIALSDGRGEAEFFEMTASGKHSLYDVSSVLSHYRLIESEPSQRMRVPKVSADEFLAERGSPRIAFAKIDVEGAEASVLSGMSRTIEQSPDLGLIVEFNPGAIVAAGMTPASFLDLFSNMGFAAWGIEHDGRLCPVEALAYPREPQDWYVNLVCAPKASGTAAKLMYRARR